MKKEFLESKHGYAIPCHNCWDGQDRVLIVCHGFGSSKSSPMVQALNQEMPGHGIGVYSFDFPSHGDSPVWQEGLRVPFCLDDLAAVEDHARDMAPHARVAGAGCRGAADNTPPRPPPAAAPVSREGGREAGLFALGGGLHAPAGGYLGG